LLPCDIRLTNIDRTLSNIVARELFYKKALKEIDNLKLDYILIDAPPYTSLIVNNILAYAEGIIIPVSPDFLTLRAFNILADTIKIIRDDINPSLKISAYYGIWLISGHSTQKMLCGILKVL